MPISDYLKNLRTRIGHDMVLIPAVCALVFNDKGEVLICRSKDDGEWHTVGGTMDPGEEPAQTAVREVKEETGVDAVPERVVGVYHGPHMKYRNGDEVTCITIAIACRQVGDAPPAVSDDESLEVRYFHPDSLPKMFPWDRSRILQAARHDPRADFVKDF